MRMINDDSHYLGKRFGRLLSVYVYRERGADKYYHRKVVCFCDCGNIRNVFTSDLERGQVISCGCYKADAARRMSEIMKAIREEELNG
ncbi:hypothetical protein [Enterobacter hormaechei]|uniref:hypothetical protein n=1 Tax=Enterobacter hormaechei TaxID=158836 RepID=UPI0029D8827B|nr:hypothetical protein [Enterobacter hormaechei]MDX7122047.1 hypothetical protein [Enterobacter hormaechei]